MYAMSNAILRIRRRALSILVQVALLGLTSCRVIGVAGDTVEFTGKVASTAIRTTGTAVVTTAKVAQTTGRIGHATVLFFAGNRKVKLEREGGSYYVRARINRKQTARLLVDTGATSVQISQRLARRLGINIYEGEAVKCTLADGSRVNGHIVTLKEVNLGGVRAKGVDAVVLDSGGDRDFDGLLGMSFLENFQFRIDTREDLLILRHRAAE